MTTLNDQITEALQSAGLKENVDFAIDTNTNKLLIITEEADRCVRDGFPGCEFSKNLAAQSPKDRSWHVFAILSEPPDRGGLADTEVETMLRSRFKEEF